MRTTNSQLPHSSTTSSLNPSKNIIIEERFLLRRLLSKQTNYNIYEGVDIEASKFVTVYIKPVRVFLFSQMWTSIFRGRLKKI